MEWDQILWNEEVRDIINDLNNRIEQLSNELTDTIIFVVADHGHHNVENLFIKDYPDIEKCLLRNTSLEPRAVNFFIKPEKKNYFLIFLIITLVKILIYIQWKM